MIRRKQGSLLLASFLLGSAMLTACGGGKSGDGTKAEGTDAGQDDPNGTANLVVYSNSGDSEDSWNERFGNAIKKKFPNYNIKYIQKTKEFGMKELITSGETIDIYWDSIGGFASGLLDNGLQYDMTELAKKHKVDLSKVEKTVADSVKLIDKDKLYGIPVFNNNMVMYYNKDIFDKFGEPYPKDGMTWSEATELARKLTRFDTKQYIGYSSSETHMLMMNQLSIPFVDQATQKANIASNPAWKTFFDTVFAGPAKAQGYDEYMKAHGNKLPYRNEFLKDREVAMFSWLSSITFVFPDDFKSMNWDEVALPTFDDKPGIGSQAYPTYFAVTSQSKQKDQAMNVIAYLLSDEVQTGLSKMGVMPVLDNDAIKKVFGQDSAFKDKNLKAAFYNKFAPIPYKSRYDSMLLTPYAKAAPQVVLTGDYNTIFRSTEEDTNKKIEEAKAAGN